MTLEWQNDIVEQLIKEDSGSTIKDFQIVLDEVERVEQATYFFELKAKFADEDQFKKAIVHRQIDRTHDLRMHQRVMF
jgi:hypothetical protein